MLWIIYLLYRWRKKCRHGIPLSEVCPDCYQDDIRLKQLTEHPRNSATGHSSIEPK